METKFQYGGNQSKSIQESVIISLLKDYIDIAPI
jgi:hypothetical protein